MKVFGGHLPKVDSTFLMAMGIAQTPLLLHFRQHSVRDVEERSRLCWAKVIEELISIPAKSIKVFDSKGDMTGRIMYSDEKVTYECVPSATTTSSPPEGSSTPEADTSSTPEEDMSSTPEEDMSSTPELPEASTAPSSAVRSSGITEQNNTVREGNRDSVLAPHLSSAASIMELGIEITHCGMKTSLVNCVQNISGCAGDLREFDLDQLRFTFKEAIKRKAKLHTNKIARCKQMTAKLSTIIAAYERRLARSIKETEQAHFQQHHQLPTKATNVHYATLSRNKKVATTVLRNLNIDL